MRCVSGRLFNEKEVREILKRVASSQPGGPSPASDGISLQELKQIGSELGLDPGQIELAASQIGAAPRQSLFSGRMILERTVEGEMTGDDWLGMVGVIQRHYKGAGALSQRGANYDWAGSDDSGSLAITAMARGGQTRIRVEANRWLEIVMASIFCPVFAVVFSFSMAKHSTPLVALPVFFFFGILLFGILRAVRAHHQQSTAGLLDRLANEVQNESAVQQTYSGIAATESQTVRS